ncbi:uncharacterized protein E0L32_003372 [Thyridium curvatum]|uniref:HMG box domain-containing protein n=1 Tax=Thyridium curvatum TaxID=1093900 RepID=A0A507BER8_9PEZI|nr:uncharacterized protein E0L32_003372 [Thyridium curvatum]TPX17254.1 hypothetical protein E0L32_003372 [Thyridium curvatum]
MARPKGSKTGEGAAKAGSSGPPRVIDVDNFIRVRDSVYARLSTIQDLIKSFSVDYLRQTNLLLGEGTNFENGADIAALENALNLLPPAPVMPQVEEKKERKKRSHDPNAPKRPLTPYFLYMQTARPIIATDLGADAPKGAVQEEGQRRWGSMSHKDKDGWNQAYQYNLRLYNARVHSYKRGNAIAKLMTDDEALKYAEEFDIPMPTGKDHDAGDESAIANQLQQNQAANEPEEPASKTPKSAKKATGKRKTATPAAETDAAKAGAASPDKKRKRTSKVTEEKEPEPKKSGRKKAKSG